MPNMNPKKCPMPEQAPDVRNKNFEEVRSATPLKWRSRKHSAA